MLLMTFSSAAEPASHWEAIFEATKNARLRAHEVQQPITAPKSSNFGLRFHPILNTNRLHRGTDYAAPEGAPFRAAGNGTVMYAQKRGDLGLTIAIKHDNGYISRYGHASESLVQPGDIVSKNQQIGLVGSTGKVTGPHLHFEMLVDGEHVNPDDIKSFYNPEQDEPTLSERIDNLLSDQQRATLMSAWSQPIGREGRFNPQLDNAFNHKRRKPDLRTTWSIANDLVKNTDLTIYQSLYAIVDFNPEAFSNGDINVRYADQPLELPTYQLIAKQCPKKAKERFYGKLNSKSAGTDNPG